MGWIKNSALKGFHSDADVFVHLIDCDSELNVS